MLEAMSVPILLSAVRSLVIKKETTWRFGVRECRGDDNKSYLLENNWKNKNYS